MAIGYDGGKDEWYTVTRNQHGRLEWHHQDGHGYVKPAEDVDVYKGKGKGQYDNGKGKGNRPPWAKDAPHGGKHGGPKGYGAKGYGKGKGKGKSHPNDKGKGKGKKGGKPYKWNVARGSYVLCLNHGCDKWGEYADSSGWECTQCGTPYDWQYFKLATEPASTEEPAPDDTMDTAGATRTDRWADEPWENLDTATDDWHWPRAAPAEPSKEVAVGTANKACSEAHAALAVSSKKVERGRKELNDMQFRLDKILLQLETHLGEMSERETAVQEMADEEIASQRLYSNRIEERDLAAKDQAESNNCKRRTAVAAVAGAKNRIDVKVEGSVQVERAAHVAAPAAASHIPATPGASYKGPSTTMLLADSGGAMDKIHYDGSDDVNVSDDEEPAPTEVTNMFEWIDHIVQWVFTSQMGELPQEADVRFLNVWENKDTAKSLSDSLVTIRDKSLAERMDQVTDAQAIRDMEATGDLNAGYYMRMQRGMYSQTKHAALLAELRVKIQESVAELQGKRTSDIANGKLQDPGKLHTKKHKARPLNKVTRVAFEKGKCAKAAAGKKTIAAETADQALQDTLNELGTAA